MFGTGGGEVAAEIFLILADGGLGGFGVGDEFLGEAEIDELGLAGLAVAMEHDVGRLDIAVQEAAGMGVVQGGGDLQRDPADFRPGHRAVFLAPSWSVAAIAILHGVVENPIVQGAVMDHRDARMVEFADGAGFARESSWFPPAPSLLPRLSYSSRITLSAVIRPSSTWRAL